MDQSASEVDDNISSHLDRVTKDQLYSAYRKIQAKYYKYRDRYTDLATHYRELDKAKSRLESVLVETQDKVLRRITDLKEQCQLEQQAKAHLEEALRNDIEEKDHIISTLNTKVKLLQANGPILENAVSEDSGLSNDGSRVNLIDLSGETASSSSNDESSMLSMENAQLKDKLKKLEALILRYKESLKRNKEKFTEMMREKSILESDHEVLKISTAEKMSALEGELSVARVEIEGLTERVNILQGREEESAISLAENKLSVHRELEEKEEQIKQLQIDLKRATEDKENLNEAIADYKAELDEFRSTHAESNAIMDKGVMMHEEDASREMSVATTSPGEQHAAMKQREENHDRANEAESDGNENMLDKLREKETKLAERQRKLDELERELAEYRKDKESFLAELSAYRAKCSELRNEYDAQKIVMEERRKDADTTIEKLQATVQSVDKELENMRSALVDRDHVCENYNKKVQQYADMLEKAKHRLTEQETQTRSLKDKLEEKTKLSKTHEEDLEIRRTESRALRTELELCRSTIDDLRNKVQADSSTISLLKKERSELTNRLVHYNDCVRRLKQDCIDIESTVKEEFSNQETAISGLGAVLAASLARFERENATLRSDVDELRSKLKRSELTTSKESEKLRTELAKAVDLESALKAELERNDELCATNDKLIAEIDNLNFKIHDLEKASHDLTQSQRQIRDLQERLKMLEHLESANRALSSEIDDLKEKHARASDAFDKVDELNAKLCEATDIIASLRSENDGDRDALREQLCASRSEIARLKIDLSENENEIKLRNEELASRKEDIEHLKSTCDNHTDVIEGYARKYVNLEADYKMAIESRANEIADLMESNKTLQETINIKLMQLKKMKITEERQSKTIEETKAELNDSRNEHAELSITLETRAKQIESLKLENAQLAKITLENKDLKDKHNDLLSRNERLRENEEASKRKIEDYEREMEELRKMAREHAESSRCRQKETGRLNDELTTSSELLERKSAELTLLKDRLLMRENELREIEENLEECNGKFRDNANTAVITSDRTAKEDDEPLLTKLREFLNEQFTRIKDMEDRNIKLTAESNDLIRQNSDMVATRSENDKLIVQLAVLRDRIVELENINSAGTELVQARVADLRNKMSNLEAENDGLRSELDVLRNAQDSSSEGLNALKSLSREKEATIKLLEHDESSALSEEKIADLQSRIDSLVRTNDALRERLEIPVRNDEIAGCQFDGDKLREENKRLEAHLDEALITFQAKETQMQLMNDELITQINQLRGQLTINEGEQGMRLKQLVKEFQAQLHDKEEELQAALEKRFGKVYRYIVYRESRTEVQRNLSICDFRDV